MFDFTSSYKSAAHNSSRLKEKCFQKFNKMVTGTSFIPERLNPARFF